MKSLLGSKNHFCLTLFNSFNPLTSKSFSTNNDHSQKVTWNIWDYKTSFQSNFDYKTNPSQHLFNNHENCFSKNPLNRTMNFSEEQSLEKLSQTTSLFILFSSKKPLVTFGEKDNGELFNNRIQTNIKCKKWKISWKTSKEVENWTHKSSKKTCIYLGEYKTKNLFLLDISGQEGEITLQKEEKFIELRRLSIFPSLGLPDQNNELKDTIYSPSDQELSVLAQGVGYLEFRRTHLFCSVCSSPTKTLISSPKVFCSNESCKREFYPRVNPVAISVPLHLENCPSLTPSPPPLSYILQNSKYCLLGRQPSWPKGRYSALAGFIETGESLEEGVLREVFEETGLKGNKSLVYYHSSQSWPFPSNLMFGSYVVVDSYNKEPPIPPLVSRMVSNERQIPLENVSPELELEDARWFSKIEAREALLHSLDSNIYNELEKVQFATPPPSAIAHQLCKYWAFYE